MITSPRNRDGQAALEKLNVPCPVLREMLATGEVREPGEGGERRPLKGNIHVGLCNALYETVRKRRPRHAVEIGLAYGASALAILAGLRDSESDGTLISIDPFQNKHWRNIGLSNAQRAGHRDRHRVIEAPSFLALPELLQAGGTCDFGYIDGWHTFDYALLDFFYLDKMCPVGGVIGFNDCGWRAVHKVTKFVKTHRKYVELDVGLRGGYRGRNFVSTIVRYLEGRRGSDRYFEKAEAGEPDWNFFAYF